MRHLNIIMCAGAGFMVGCMTLSGCKANYSVVEVEGGRVAMTDVYDKHPDKEAEAIVAHYQKTIDSIMSPVVAHAAAELKAYRPESPLSNLIADVLRRSAKPTLGKEADVAVMNMGGIRSEFSKGDITYGNVFETAPFENALCLLTMDGATLQKLFTQIAAVHGEGLSGAQLVISRDGKLISATVGGKPIAPTRLYTVATIDYLAEGNDKMPAFREAKTKQLPKGKRLRDLLLQYVEECERKGEFVDAKVEGRVVVK